MQLPWTSLRVLYFFLHACLAWETKKFLDLVEFIFLKTKKVLGFKVRRFKKSFINRWTNELNYELFAFTEEILTG